jgi:hypothetical protein
MSKSTQPQAKKVDVVGSARELAMMMKNDPSLIEREVLNQGDELIGFYQDPNFGDGFQNLRSLKLEILEMAIQDVSGGVMTLRSSSIGVAFRGRSLTTYISPHGSNPSGTVVFSVNWKNIKAFQNWRNDQGEDITQDEINTAIYRLAAAMSELL